MTAPAPSVGWRPWLGFTAMTLGMFMAILDIQIVASSLIDIQVALAIPADKLSYIQTTYLIAEVIAIALTGFLTRALSTRWLFVMAMTGFVLASAACAGSTAYTALYVARFIQGLFGGAIIPLVFTSAFLLFPPRQQALATVIGGGFAMLAPTLGPFIGGWITENYSWHWLFLINLLPGLAMAAIVAATVKVDAPDWPLLKRIDIAALAYATVFLATLELVLKEAPQWGWSDGATMGLAALCVTTAVLGLRRCLARAEPLIDLRLFVDATFAVGAWFSFVLGMALFGMVYLLPLFLGLVRGHGPLTIGTIMIVTGAAQLVAAPFATWAERRLDARIMAGVGYALFAVGLAWNALATPAWDFDQLLGPQIVRGAAVMICLLPITRLALGQLTPEHLAQGSALFNLMRNIGGAVGIALIDTVIETRTAGHAERIVTALQAGDRDMAAFVGLPLERFTGVPLGDVDATAMEFARPLVEKAAAVMSFNEAWAMIAALVALSLLALPLMKRSSPSANSAPRSPRGSAPTTRPH